MRIRENCPEMLSRTESIQPEAHDNLIHTKNSFRSVTLTIQLFFTRYQ